MDAHPADWFPPCYTEESLLIAIQAALGVTPAIAGVARWLPEGATSDRIGAALGKSVHTVKLQARQLELTLGMTNRTGIAARIVALLWHHAWKSGDLAVPPPTERVVPGE